MTRPGRGGPAGHWVMVMSPDWSVAEITCGDVGLCGTLIEVGPDEVLALTRYVVGPGGAPA